MPAKRPNIIFCHVDQLHHEAISGLGCTDVSTPNIDRIHREGKSFARAQASYPVCSPSRSAWFTGRMPSENGVIDNGFALLDEMPDLGHWMSARGYDCFYAGKWHLSRKVDDCFKVLYPQFGLGERNDDDLAQAIESFLQEHQGEKPFFLSIGFLNPHDCCYLDIPVNDLLTTKLGVESHLDLPPLPPDYNPKLPMASFPKEAEAKSRNWTPEEVSLYRYYYYRLVERVDAAVGRVYDAVQNMADAANTLFIFVSDHGEMMGHRNRFKKFVLYDASLRVPLVFVQPGKIAPGTRDLEHIVGGVDLTATILDYAGMEMMPEMNFALSARPLIEGTPTKWHTYVPAETTYVGVQQSFRAGKYKSIYRVDVLSVELYDTDADPLEQNNLADQPAFASVRQEHDNYQKDYVSKIKPSPEYLKALAGKKSKTNG